MEIMYETVDKQCVVPITTYVITWLIHNLRRAYKLSSSLIRQRELQNIHNSGHIAKNSFQMLKSVTDAFVMLLINWQ